MTTVPEYPVHTLAILFPLMLGEEFRKLKADIATHGLGEPITLSSDGKILLDGRNRLKACRELGIAPRTVNLTETVSEADFIWSKNVLRRHLTDDQRAVIANKWSDAERAAAKERQKASQARPGEKVGTRVVANSPPPLKTRKALATKAQVTEHKIRQVETVAKHAPELLPRVESGEMKLKDATAQASDTARQLKTSERFTSDPPERKNEPRGIHVLIPAPGHNRTYKLTMERAVTQLLAVLGQQGCLPLRDASGRVLEFETPKDGCVKCRILPKESA